MSLPDREYEWPDQLAGFWDQIEYTDHLTDYEKATIIDTANELFDIAYVSEGYTTEERQGFRDEFFDLMSDYGFDVADFPWDEWRDWYE